MNLESSTRFEMPAMKKYLAVRKKYVYRKSWNSEEAIKIIETRDFIMEKLEEIEGVICSNVENARAEAEVQARTERAKRELKRVFEDFALRYELDKTKIDLSIAEYRIQSATARIRKVLSEYYIFVEKYFEEEGYMDLKSARSVSRSVQRIKNEITGSLKDLAIYLYDRQENQY